MDTDVVVVGGGPVGLMLAAELRLGGVRTVLLERLPQRSEATKANGLVGQVVRVLDYRGLYQPAGPGWLRTLTKRDRRDRPRPTPFFMFGGFRLDLRRLDENPVYTMAIPQARLEQVLGQRALDLHAEVRRGHDVTGFTQDEAGVTVDVDSPTGSYRIRARYLVGCDGAHSVVRKRAGVAFPGVTTDNVTSRNAHVVLPRKMLTRWSGELRLTSGERFAPFMFHRTEGGVFSFASFRQGLHVVSSYEWDRPPIDEQEPMTVAELRDSVQRVLGSDLPMDPPPPSAKNVLRRVTSRNTRLADRYRAGRILLAGDAAHVFSGFGGPGLNLGLQDAVNLGWKLAADIHGWAPPGLLDTYHTERHPLGQRVTEQTQEQAALLAPGDEVTARREEFGRFLEDEANLRHIAETVAGTDIPYAMPRTPPYETLLGRLAPDLDLVTAGGRTRVGKLMRSGRPVLLDLTGGATLGHIAQAWRDRVDVMPARSPTPVAALLIRPDGYVAWAAHRDSPHRTVDDGLREALVTWFGAPGVIPVRREE